VANKVRYRVTITREWRGERAISKKPPEKSAA
jgi:hypothetical protein